MAPREVEKPPTPVTKTLHLRLHEDHCRRRAAQLPAPEIAPAKAVHQASVAPHHHDEVLEKAEGRPQLSVGGALAFQNGGDGALRPRKLVRLDRHDSQAQVEVKAEPRDPEPQLALHRDRHLEI